MRKLWLGLAFAFFASASSVGAFSCSSNGTGGGNFNVPATWTACNSTTPQTTDSITINNGDTVTLVATTTVAGITINNGGIFAANTRTLTNTDGYTNNGSHTGTTSAMTLSGIAGTVIAGNGSYTPTGIVTISVGDKTVASGSALSIPSVTVTGVVLTNNSTAGFSVTTALAGTGTLTQGSSAILNIGGTSGITTLTATASPNEVHYTSTTANQTIKSTTYHHLFIDKAGRVGTLGGVTTINGSLSVTAGTLADGGFQITGNGTGTLTLAAGTTLTLGVVATATSFPTTFTAGHIALNATSTVNYNSNLAQTISELPTYGNLTTTATGAVTKTAAGAVTIAGLFTNGTNNTFADGGFTITVKDGATMTGTHTGSGKILFTGGSASHSVSGTYQNVELDDSNGVLLSGTTTINGTLTITSGSFDTDARLTVVTGATTVNGGSLLISSTTQTKTFADITIASGAAMNFTAAEAVTINGNLTVNGTGVISGTSGVWTLQKIGGGSIGGTTTALTILGSLTFATSYTLPSTFTVNTMSVSTGITETNAGTTTINTSLAGAGTFTQSAGSILNLGGTTTVTTLDASVNSNEVHYTSTTAAQTVKTATYYNLFLDKPGRTGTMSGNTTVLGNFTSTADTTDFVGSTVSITGTSDIYGILKDQNNTGLVTFGGLLTMHSASSWSGNAAEACNFTFHNGMQYDGGTFVPGSGFFTFDTNNQSVTGSAAITIGKLVVTGVQLTNNNTSSITVSTSLTGTGEFIQGTSANLNIADTSTITTLTATASGNRVSYIGVVPQTIKDTTYATLDVSTNASGSVDVVAETSVNTLLKLGDTKLSALTAKVNLATSATLSRVTGYVIGKVHKVFNASTSFTFPIGLPGSYSPMDLTFTGISNNGNVDATNTGTLLWTLTNNGLTFAAYDLVLNFDTIDPTDKVIYKDGVAISSICTASSCSATGLTSMSNFTIGVRPSPSPTSTTSSTSTSTTSTTSSPTPTPIVPGFPPTGTQAATIPKLEAPSAAVALFDILATPLLNASSNVKLIIVAASLFLVGCGLGLFIVLLI